MVIHLTEILSRLFKAAWISLILLGGCIRLEPVATSTGTLDFTPTTAQVSDATPNPRWINANDLVKGICFDAAAQLANATYVIHTSAEWTQFNQRFTSLCQEPVRLEPLVLEDGDVLVGTWSTGQGCTAEHQVNNFQWDASNRTIALYVEFAVSGECPYELIRPFWVILKQAAGYQITLTITHAAAS